MAFSDTIKTQAFRRSGGRCECRRNAHSHTGRCTTRLTMQSAEFHHIHASSEGGHDGLSNCEVLCSACHKLTPSYGR
jgi:5-methylcytosine-specific restriction endonuclease McrA